MITVADLTSEQRNILEKWEEIARENHVGTTFSIDEETKHSALDARLEQFLENPTEETFTTLWNTIYSAQRAGSPEYILNSKWRENGRTIEDLADFIAEIANSDEYHDEWEDRLGSKRPLREFFGRLHVNSQPIIDMRAIRGLAFFDAVDSADRLKRKRFSEQRALFADFKNVYRAEVGHATADTDHELPLNLEIYLLFVLVKRASKTKLTEEVNDHIQEFYRLVLEEQEQHAEREESEENTAVDAKEQPNYFWIVANPTDQRTESIVKGFDKGEEVFYPAYNRYGNKRRVFSAFQAATPGDKVLFYGSSPIHGIVAEGEIVEGLHKEEHEEHDDPVEGLTIKYRRSIEKIPWEQLNSTSALEEASPLARTSAGTLFHLTAEEYDSILSLEDATDEKPETLREKLEPITVNFELPAELYFEDAASLRSEIEASLNSGKHIIFTGPPGTGKTKLAKEICRQCVADLSQVDGHTFTTATSDWTAFDTIGGYVPARDAENANEELAFQPRLFLNCFRRKQDGIVNDWLVIDEINRSDIDKAFGQLFSVLSGDSVELPYERKNQVEIVSVDSDASEEDLRAIAANPDTFPVTPSWRLFATMNTYDKASLYEMSYAFMRRFNFIHVGIPNLETPSGAVRASLLDPETSDNYAAAWLEEDPSLEATLEAVFAELTVIWAVVNSYGRSIGPSIVRDILRYVDAYGATDQPARRKEALTAAIVGMVYPQLEGLRPETQRNLVRSFEGEWETDRGEVTLDLNQERLRVKAADFFDIQFADE